MASRVGMMTPNYETGCHTFWCMDTSDLVKLPKRDKTGEDGLSGIYANHGANCLIYSSGDLAYYSADTDEWEIM